MKKFSLTTLLIIITLGFSSCTQDDTLALEDPTTALYQKMTVGRDASGAYSIDYKLNDGVGSDITDNKNGNGKDIYLYSSDNEIRKNVNENVFLNGNDRFTIGINNTIANTKSRLTVYDDDIRFSKSTSEDDHLAEYQMTDNGDGTYSLDFTVNPNITVEYVYDEDNNVYEIHLKEGSQTQSDFTQTFTKEEGSDLNIEFVNFSNNTSSTSKSLEEAAATRKPKVIINED